MSSESFVPRIAFENSDDEATVYLALVHYIRLQTGNVLMGRMGAVSELANAASLVKEIQENAKCREEFGPIPTDEDLSRFLENGDK
ncbi:hypothetical protein SEA_RICKROSS_9 [Streptomyces phage RickRoss]|nr:hypothetical protein SEA_RICKROSS_9 [Streptomyces phage RickRoss]